MHKEDSAMAKGGIKRRASRRFEIPGAKTRYKKSGLNVLAKGFSVNYPVLNVSKGGLAFVCDKRLRRGNRLMLQLLVPNERHFHLRGLVKRRDQRVNSSNFLVAVEFRPFNGDRKQNTIESLVMLRKLDSQYGKEVKGFWAGI